MPVIGMKTDSNRGTMLFIKKTHREMRYPNLTFFNKLIDDNIEHVLRTTKQRKKHFKIFY